MPIINSGYTLTCYFNTGFNGVDIPAKPSVLENATKRVYNDNYFLREDLDKPVLSVNDTYAHLRDCDYVKLEPKQGNDDGVTCYFFCVPSAQARGTTSLALDLDALLTMGGAENLNYISGWQERGHIAKADDDYFNNVAPENFSPSRPLILRGGSNDIEASDTASNDASIIVSTVDLMDTATGSTVDVITGVDSLGEEKMYFPQIKVNGDDYITEFDQLVSWADPSTSPLFTFFKLPSTTAFLYSNSKVKEGLKALYSAGQLSLMASYIIPKSYLSPSTPIEVYSDKVGAIHRIKGLYENISVSGNDYKFAFPVDNYTVKNKKAYSLYHQYELLNVASGAMVIKDAHDLYKDGDEKPNVILWVDPSPNGKPVTRFAYIRDSENLFSDAVYGSPWYQQQLVFEGASGSLWNSINASYTAATLARQKQENTLTQGYTDTQLGRDLARLDYNVEFALESQAIDAGFNLVTGAAGFAGNIATGRFGEALTSGVSGLHQSVNAGREMGNTLSQWAFDKADKQAQYDYTKASQALQKSGILQAINENRVGLLKNNVIVAPTVMFTPNDSLALYRQNRFLTYHITMDDADIIEFDKYLQRYGYNGIHRPLTASCFTCRQYYTYVQAFDINIKSAFGMRIRQKAINQLNGGVRVWRVLPDASYYDTN